MPDRNGVNTVVLNIPEDLLRAYEVIKELRTGLEFDDFARLTKLANAADGYRLVARELHQNNKRQVLAVMGYRILHDLVHGTHIYIDDLVTTEAHRSQGHGAELLKYAEREARRLGINRLRLCTGVNRPDAERFYKREGWELKAVVFKKNVPSH